MEAVDGALVEYDDAEQRAITAYLQRALEICGGYASMEGSS